MDTLLLFIGVFMVFAVLVKLPVAFGLGWAAFVVFIVKSMPMAIFSQTAFSSMDSFPLLAIPFFLLAGTIMEHSGISRSLIAMIDAFVGKIKGSMGLVTIIGCMAFGTLTGSAFATMAAIGKIMLPELDRKGYSRSYSGALLSSTCFLGFLIPPSTAGIIYAVAAGQKIPEVWLSTIGPAFLFALGYSIINYFKSSKEEIEVHEKAGFVGYIKNASAKTVQATGAILMPVIIFGGIYGGVFTPTEAGAVSAFYGLIFYVYKKLLRKGETTSSITQVMINSAALTGTVGVLIIFSMIASRAVTLSGATGVLTDFLVGNITNPSYFLVAVIILYIIMGMFIDTICSILLITPLLMPSVTAFGIDPVHFGAITLVALCIGYNTPPFASGIFFASKLVGEGFTNILREVAPFVAVALAVTFITAFYSPVALFIPELVR